MAWLLQQICFCLTIAFTLLVRFRVGAIYFQTQQSFNILKPLPWHFIFELRNEYTTTNIIKYCQVHNNLFQIKLNPLLMPHNINFTLKWSQNMQEAT